MARKKLYGAAATARKKRLAKLKRKRKPAKRNPARKGSSAKRKAAARKGAATRKRKAAARSTSARKAARTRKRRTGARKNPARKRRTAKRRTTVKRRRTTKRRSYKRNPAPKRRRLSAAARKRRKSYGGKRSSRGMKSISKARKSIRASKRRGGLSGAFVRKYKMKTNPGGIMQAVKTALPIAGSYYVSKLVSNKLGDLPAVGNVLSKLQVGQYNLGKPVLSGLILAGAHYGTRKGGMAKHRTGLMLGTALAFIDSIISTFAPADVKAMMGVGEYVSVGEYVPTGEYVASGDYVRGVAPDVHGLHAVDGYPGEASANLHEIHAIHGIDAELGAIEAGADVGIANGIFANGW